MGTINYDPYNLNEQRGFPVDDGATGVDDAGNFLPHGLLVDIQIALPQTYGTSAYLTALTVTPNVITAVFAAEGSDTPIAAATVAGVVPYQSYPLMALADGVVGWINFGFPAATGMSYAGRFSTAAQGRLLARCVRTYPQPRIPSIGKQGLGTALQGLVALHAGQDISITTGRVAIHGVATVDAILIGLNSTLNQNVFQLYTGDCNGRPESNTCNKTPLQTINGVSPDCTGNIDLNFQGIVAKPNPAGGGILLSIGVSIASACGASDIPTDGVIPGLWTDEWEFLDSSHGSSYGYGSHG